MITGFMGHAAVYNLAFQAQKQQRKRTEKQKHDDKAKESRLERLVRADKQRVKGKKEAHPQGHCRQPQVQQQQEAQQQQAQQQQAQQQQEAQQQQPPAAEPW